MKGVDGLYVLDFDGVICQSTDECMITAYNAWSRYTKDSSSFKAVEDVPPEEAALFRRGRGYVRGGAEYFILMKSIKERFVLRNQEHFAALGKDWAANLKDFDALFYEARRRLVAESEERWLGLHTVFAEVMRELASRLHSENTIIVTMKDRESVIRILTGAGLPFPGTRVLDKDDFKTKAAALTHLAGRYGLPHEKVRFLDDNVLHLLEPREAGFTVYFALWGYHTPEHLEIARASGIAEMELGAVTDFFAV